MSDYLAHILVVEDDKKIRSFVTYALEKECFKVSIAECLNQAMNILIYDPIDLLILDLGLPDGDGKDLIKKIREWSDIPIIILSARDCEKEKVTALDMGADDYLTKPFFTSELMARIRVALRHRFSSKEEGKKIIYNVRDLELKLDAHTVKIRGEEIHLSPLEFNLLSLLFKHQGKVLTTKTIMKNIYGDEYISDTRSLRTLMSSLRRKIEKEPSKPEYILTEVGVGYKLIN